MGFISIAQSIKGNFVTAVYMIMGSVILDGLDGAVARLTKTESNFGVQLDSLVDAVAFGCTTAVMIYMWGFHSAYPSLGQVVGFLFLSAGVIRLARFNVLKEAETYVANVFIGLPIPLGALSVGSFILLFKEPLNNENNIMLFSGYVLVIAFLMISNFKFRTMKRLNSRYNLLILFLIALVVAMLISFPSYTIPAMCGLYLLSPIYFGITGKFKKQFPTEEAASASVQPTPEKPEKE